MHQDKSTKRWIINFETPAGERTAVAKHLVQATGLGSQVPYRPKIADEHLYKGISIHSTQYKNGKELKDKGAKVSRDEAAVFRVANLSNHTLSDCPCGRLGQYSI